MFHISFLPCHCQLQRGIRFICVLPKTPSSICCVSHEFISKARGNTIGLIYKVMQKYELRYIQGIQCLFSLTIKYNDKNIWCNLNKFGPVPEISCLWNNVLFKGYTLLPASKTGHILYIIYLVFLCLILIQLIFVSTPVQIEFFNWDETILDMAT